MYWNIKFNKHPSSGNRIIPCGQTDTTKQIVSFRSYCVHVRTSTVQSLSHSFVIKPFAWNMAHQATSSCTCCVANTLFWLSAYPSVWRTSTRNRCMKARGGPTVDRGRFWSLSKFICRPMTINSSSLTSIFGINLSLLSSLLPNEDN